MLPSLRRTQTLDRLSHLRNRPDEIAKLMRSNASRFLVVIGGRPVIQSNLERTDASLNWQDYKTVAPLIAGGANWAFLGRNVASKLDHFALFLSENDAAPAEAPEPNTDSPSHPAIDLRSLAAQGVITPDEQSLAGQATALAHWHADTRCCGRCGSKTISDQAGWRRKCWACGRVSFPRMDPAVIMLVTDGERAVLAHEPRFPDNMYSTLAGFVEPGDDVVHAVRRETFEEVGLEVHDVEFFNSQPWPFPHNLMLGCLAFTEPAELKPDTNELDDARWFSRQELQSMHDGDHPEGLWFPGSQSLAYALIMRFLNSA